MEKAGLTHILKTTGKFTSFRKRRSDTRSDGGAGQDESLDDVDELNHKGDAAGKVDKGQSFHPDAEKSSLALEGGFALTPTILIINLNGASFNPAFNGTGNGDNLAVVQFNS